MVCVVFVKIISLLFVFCFVKNLGTFDGKVKFSIELTKYENSEIVLINSTTYPERETSF